MKKLGTVVAALVMCFAMATTAFAASPVKVESATEGVTVVENKEVQAAVQAKLSTPEQLKEVLGDSYKEGAAVLAIFELEGAPGKVTLNVTGINAGDTIKVLHWNNGLEAAPEVLDATAEAGKVTFTTASFSPFAIVRVAAAAGNGAASPKTGEAGATAAMAIVVLSAAGIVVLNRKKAA